MAKAKIGAHVMFCGHEGWFIADIWAVGNVNVVRASGPVSGDNITRTDLHTATHLMVDFPESGFWQPRMGIFVVPEKQVRELTLAVKPKVA